MRIVAGKYKNKYLETPRGDITRPTSSQLREALFNIVQHYIEDATFLDLFAGSGAMGFEALSRGAKEVTFIDNDRHSIISIKKNAKLLEVEKQVKIFTVDALEGVQKLIKNKQSFSIIYIDPPYTTKIEESLATQLLTLIDRSSLLTSGGHLFLEESKDYHLPQNLTQLQFIDSRRLGRSFLYQFKQP
ncbi:Ribosomal RNA small subunit methyltransferase D [Candidatus Rubidus massiliensis]|nr:Ribosomal RNA small subunit methyltransferase D [Candidatus Rubidus massiliensis]